MFYYSTGKDNARESPSIAEDKKLSLLGVDDAWASRGVESPLTLARG